MLNFDNDVQFRKTYGNINITFLIVEEILAFASSANFVTEVKNVSTNFKGIA